MDPSQAYAAIAAADARIDQLRGEPEKIRLWREESNKRLAEKGKTNFVPWLPKLFIVRLNYKRFNIVAFEKTGFIYCWRCLFLTIKMLIVNCCYRY